MNVSFYEVENILKTLPIGYYAKREIKTSLSETSDSSFYDMMNDEIVISFSCIRDVLKYLDDDSDLEETVRTLLYHEVSHGILTPGSLMVTNEVNIFEDERIESLLKDFYLGIDFKKLVVRVNKYTGQKPTTADEAFYYLVRFRAGDKKWLDEVHELIIKYKNLNRITPGFIARTYKHEIQSLYRRFTDEWNTINKSESSESDTSRLQATDSSDASSETINVLNDIDDTESEKITDIAVNKAFSGFNDADVNSKLFQILDRTSKRTKQNASAVNAYSGVFDPRSVVRDDYKYFAQKSRVGHIRQFSKIHLNLFIDCSGSFHSSELKTNQLLHALTLYEKKVQDFSFDCVFCSIGERLASKSHRVLKCDGGNRLDNEIFDIYRQLQSGDATNYNIVLFDGDAFTDSYGSQRVNDRKNFAAFNHQNCVIISDPTNQFVIEKYCDRAKRIFTDNYVDELFKHVFISMTQLMK